MPRSLILQAEGGAGLAWGEDGVGSSNDDIPHSRDSRDTLAGLASAINTLNSQNGKTEKGTKSQPTTASEACRYLAALLDTPETKTLQNKDCNLLCCCCGIGCSVIPSAWARVPPYL